jgi:hypothetical protein
MLEAVKAAFCSLSNVGTCTCSGLEDKGEYNYKKIHDRVIYSWLECEGDINISNS